MNVMTTFMFYFLVFAVLHSLLATDSIKNLAKTKLREKFRFYRIIYNILSFITAAPAFFVWMTSSSSTVLIYSVTGWLSFLLLILRSLAFGIFAYAMLQKDLLEFAGFRQSKTERKLITGGVYGIVRHPLYVAGIILIFTKPEMTLLDLIAAALVSIYLITGAYIEERRLISTFGDRYRKYQEQVSMFIP
jgi:protein-S-isoprenylcysteine O-methyltransferase Ste14